MFSGNPNLRGDGESLQMEVWQLEELRKCVRDPVYFANNYVKITTKDKGIQLFDTWEFQSDLIRTMKDNRFVVAKFPRQCGKSTTTRAFLLWQALFTRDITIAILANKLALAMEQLQQLKESYAMLPYWMQPGLVEWNKKRIQLCHNTKVMCAATSPDGIRGLSVNILYIDEFAFIPNYIADEFIASIFPTISSGQTTKIFITSTPKGLNHFHSVWDGALKGPGHKDWNKFIPKEIPWNAVPGRDEEWARTQIRQLGEIRFNQEFKCDFVGSVSTLIDHNFLKSMKPVEALSLPKLPDYVQIWELPRPKELMEQKNWEYVACLDASYGVRADSSVLKVYLAKSNITLHLVAQISANDMEIDEFAEKSYQLLQRYHQPHLIIEMNGPGTAAMQYFHLKAEYENLVHFDPKGRMMGLWAGDKLKNAAVIMLKSYVQRKLIKDFDADTIAELYSFGKVTKEKWGAMGGNHDDHVMAMLWCIYYVNSPLFYGNIVEANIAGMNNPELGLVIESEEKLKEESETIQTMRDYNFHKTELENAATYNPYERDGYGNGNNVNDYTIDDDNDYTDDDDEPYIGAFRT